MALLENLEALLARGTDNALLRFGLGQACLKAGRHNDAIAHLRRCLEHDPKYSAAWKLLGQALADSGRNAEAITAYEDGIRAAEEKGDVQAAKEMGVFLKRLRKQAP